MKITIVGAHGAAGPAVIKRLAWLDKKQVKVFSASNSNTGKQQAHSLRTLKKVNQLGMLGVLLGTLTLPAQAMTVITVDGVAQRAFTLDGDRQFDNEYLYAATEQGELAEITITFDETLIGINGNYSFSATDPISEFDISMQILGQTFGRETDIDGDVMGAPYFNVRNYHTPGATTFALEWVISEIDLPEGIPLFEDGSLGANFSDIIEPSIVSLVLYDNGAFQVNNPTVTTGNRYNVGIDLVVTAVPVPATAWMFVTGLAGLAGVSSRRRMKP